MNLAGCSQWWNASTSMRVFILLEIFSSSLFSLPPPPPLLKVLLFFLLSYNYVVRLERGWRVGGKLKLFPVFRTDKLANDLHHFLRILLLANFFPSFYYHLSVGSIINICRWHFQNRIPHSCCSWRCSRRQLCGNFGYNSWCYYIKYVSW